MAFERAELADTSKEQERHLTFVIIGAGPTGVEMAGAIAELANISLRGDFRRISPDNARIILVEGGPRVLGAFAERLSGKAKASLEKLGVDVRTGAMVEDVTGDHVVVAGEKIPAATVIWAAGVKVDHLETWLGVETDRVGRVAVEPDLTVPGMPNVSVIGDAAKVPWKDGFDVPGIAPAAKQEG